MESILYALCLQRIPFIGLAAKNTLLQQAGSAKNIFINASAYNYYGYQHPETHAAFQTQNDALKQAELELDWCNKNNIQILTQDNPGYPPLLLQMPDAPLVLFVKGQLPLTLHTVSVVGTRKPSQRAEANVKRMVGPLQQIPCAIISGLAYGIDRMAHEAAIEHKIPTWAVMGTGLDTVYPTLHKSLAHLILDRGGAWISEQCSKSLVHPGVFPKRNRIISGLSQAIVVIESTCKGGSMITARLGQDYHRDVFAVCGRPDDTTSAGCHALIKHHLAQLIENGEDLLEAMSWKEHFARKIKKSSQKHIHPDHASLWKLFLQKDQWTMDALYETGSYNAAQLAEGLFYLETEQLIKAYPGARYQRL